MAAEPAGGATAGHEAHDDIGAEDALWRLFLANLPKALVGNAACAMLFGTALWWESRDWIVPAWVGCVVALTILRYAILRAFRDAALRSEGSRPARRMQVAMTGLGGALWGFGYFVIVPGDDFALHMLTCVFAAGLAAGALLSASNVLSAYVLFVLGVSVPLTAFLVAQGTVAHLVVAVAVILYTALTIGMARAMKSQTREVFLTRSANRALIRDLEAARDRALESDRIKSRFLATMSHELRTPLNVILGFSKTIESCPYGPLGDERYAEHAMTIRESGEHLLDLINDVLDLSRIEAGEYPYTPEWMDAADVLNSIVRALRPSAETAGVELALDTGGDLPLTCADERALRQILLNLLSNAIKFTPEGGRVAVTAAPLPEGGLSIAVRDTGVGIPPDDQQRVLRPFVQADNANDRRYEGTGLGLALSKQLAELHGGTLLLDSTPGEGTEVTVTLPSTSAPVHEETA